MTTTATEARVQSSSVQPAGICWITCEKERQDNRKTFWNFLPACFFLRRWIFLSRGTSEVHASHKVCQAAATSTAPGRRTRVISTQGHKGKFQLGQRNGTEVAGVKKTHTHAHTPERCPSRWRIKTPTYVYWRHNPPRTSPLSEQHGFFGAKKRQILTGESAVSFQLPTPACSEQIKTSCTLTYINNSLRE